MNQQDEHLGQSLFSSRVVAWTHRHTDTHTRHTDCSTWTSNLVGNHNTIQYNIITCTYLQRAHSQPLGPNLRRGQSLWCGATTGRHKRCFLKEAKDGPLRILTGISLHIEGAASTETSSTYAYDCGNCGSSQQLLHFA